MSIGPVEYLVLGFEGERIGDEVVRALAELVGTAAVRILDLVVLVKDELGDLVVFEHDQLDELAVLRAEATGLLTDEDLALAAELLEPGSAAAFVVWEDRWAERLAAALRHSGGSILAGERIPDEVVSAALAAGEGSST